jgi:hypothetical protein
MIFRECDKLKPDWEGPPIIIRTNATGHDIFAREPLTDAQADWLNANRIRYRQTGDVVGGAAVTFPDSLYKIMKDWAGKKISTLDFMGLRTHRKESDWRSMFLPLWLMYRSQTGRTDFDFEETALAGEQKLGQELKYVMDQVRGLRIEVRWRLRECMLYLSRELRMLLDTQGRVAFPEGSISLELPTNRKKRQAPDDFAHPLATKRPANERAAIVIQGPSSQGKSITNTKKQKKRKVQK